MTLLVFNIVTIFGFFYSWRKQTAITTPTAALFFLFQINLDSWRDK